MSDADGPDAPAWLSLGPDEQVTLRTGPSRTLLLAAFGLAFVLLVVLSVLVGLVRDVGTGRRLSAVIIVLTVGTILYAFYTIKRREYVVTDERAIVGVGLWSPNVEQVALAAVEDIVVERATWQRWLGTGTVRFEDGTDRPLTYAFVEQPHVVAERILPLVTASSDADTTVTGGH